MERDRVDERAGRHRGHVGHAAHDSTGGSHRSDPADGWTGRSGGPADPAPRDATGGLRPAALDLVLGLGVLALAVLVGDPGGPVAAAVGALAAPLLAVAVGGWAALLVSGGPRRVGFLLGALLCGTALVALGIVLSPLEAGSGAVLAPTGLLVVVLAPLALVLWRLPVLTVGAALAVAVVGPLVVVRARDDLAAQGLGTVQVALLEWTAAGDHLRLVSMLPAALAGLALGAALTRDAGARAGTAAATVLAVAAVAAHVLGRGTVDGSVPSSGSTTEVVSTTLLAGAALVLAVVVAGGTGERRTTHGALAPLASAGRLALSAYVLELLLAALVELATGGADGSRLLTLALVAVVPAAAWAVRRRWGTGPLEWALTRLARMAGTGPDRAAVSGRSGGSR